MTRKVDDKFVVTDRRGKILRLAAAIGRPLMLINNLNVRWGEGKPYLFAEHEMTALERVAHDHIERPGVWYQSPFDPSAYLVGDGRQLTQAETDLLIVAELYRESTRVDADMLEGLWGPPVVMRENSVTIRQQRGGVHSDPLIRVAAARAWGLRDFQWPIKCEVPSCELARYHDGHHAFTFWRTVVDGSPSNPDRFRDDSRLEGYQKLFDDYPNSAPTTQRLFSVLLESNHVASMCGVYTMRAGEIISRGARLVGGLDGRAYLYTSPERLGWPALGYAQTTASEGEDVVIRSMPVDMLRTHQPNAQQQPRTSIWHPDATPEERATYAELAAKDKARRVEFDAIDRSVLDGNGDVLIELAPTVGETTD